MKSKQFIKARRIFSSTIFYLVLCVITFLCLLPFFWTIVTTFKPTAEIFSYPPRIIATNPTLEAYERSFSSPQTLRSFFNSVWLSTVSTLAVIVLGSISGYGMSRFTFRGRGGLRVAILITQMLPPIFVLIPYFHLVNALGLYNTYGALLLGWCTLPVPFTTMMLHGIFNSLPTDLDDSALVDGCTRLGALFRIILPAGAPSILGAAAMIFVMIWGDLLLVLVMSRSTEIWTIIALLSSKVNDFSQKWNDLAVLSLVASVPLVVVWIFAQRYVVRGMTAGLGK